ncbi:MAG TPA: glycosyltransferase [Candidatus Limnocylindria bacterium]|jgi:succinoglycan biosynthesis protein ExoA|nr:glycosyltransferase [Candidatus Limnocylindria bacterium]
MSRGSDALGQPVVDVIMSTFDEERDVERSVDAVLAQTWPVCLTVVDGGSTDRTVDILLRRAASEPRLHVIADGVRRSLPAALNLALSHTCQPFVAKVDARTFLAPDFLTQALAVLSEPGAQDVACAGGQPEQFGSTPFGDGVARARRSVYGVGGSGYADHRPRAEVASVQCGVYRRAALDQIGRFDPALQYGEDDELNWRLRMLGWRIVRDERIRFRYLTRPSWRSAFRQYRNYGRARVAVWEKHPGFLRPYHLAPSAALVGGAALALLAPFSREARACVAAGTVLYGAGALVAALAGSEGRVERVPHTVAAFTALHGGYGLGLVEALAARLGPHRRAARA